MEKAVSKSMKNMIDLCSQVLASANCKKKQFCKFPLKVDQYKKKKKKMVSAKIPGGESELVDTLDKIKFFFYTFPLGRRG